MSSSEFEKLKRHKMFTVIGEGYWEDGGSCDDATRLIGQELVKCYRCGSVNILTTAGRRLCVCHTDDWQRVGGWEAFLMSQPPTFIEEDLHTRLWYNQRSRITTKQTTARLILSLSPAETERRKYFLLMMLVKTQVCRWSWLIWNHLPHHLTFSNVFLWKGGNWDFLKRWCKLISSHNAS